uniref:Retinoblastoma 1 n=1 Tax=Astyanax mexicanus TaxID=7994 RepID=A0A8B9KIQ7_ASTMX
ENVMKMNCIENVSYLQFCDLVRKLDENVDTISSEVNSTVMKLEKKYDVSLALYQRFGNQSVHTSVLCLSLSCFLDCAGSALQMEDDLVISFQILLCVLEFCTKRCPSTLLQPLYKSAVSATAQSPPTRTSRRNKAKPRPPEMDVQLLETLCKESDCSMDEVKNVYQSSFCAFLDSLSLSGSQEFPAVETLSKKYDELYHKNKDFDARLFLDDDETLCPGKEEAYVLIITKNQSGEENVLVPPQTPIRAAMNSIQQLRGGLTSASDQPSGNLIVYFKNCTVDPSEEITKRVGQLGQIFCQKFAEAVGQRCEGLGKTRFTLGVQLHYKVMESMLKSVSRNTCSLKNGGSESPETDLCFPWILDVFQLHAFDFYKVIESFIKAEPTLKHDMIEHLGRCEHQIMESIAWKAVSFTVVKFHDLATVLEFTELLRETHSFANVCRSIYRMAYLRLKMLFSHLLNSHTELEPIIWTLLQHTLQNEYELMKDRHLDQLMMSAMYAICKVKNVDLRFKTIVTVYKELPNTNQETFKRVLIREGQYDSIIVFYNLVFMQKLKTNILQYSSPRPPPLSPIPHIPRSPYKYPSSPLRVPGGNVYISPLKSNRLTPAAMTPRSRFLVSIGESFGTSDKFQKINQMVSSTDWSLKRRLDGDATPKPLKKLRFDVDGQDEADGSKSSCESTMIQKLAEISKLYFLFTTLFGL